MSAIAQTRPVRPVPGLPPRAPARVAPGRGSSRLSRIAAAIARRPGRAATGVVFTAALAAVTVNALFLQTERHPRPLAAASVAAPVAPPSRPADLAPRPAIADPVTTGAATPTPPPAPAQRVLATQSAPRSRDAIGDILKASAPEGGDASVQAAQRALNRLGYGPIEVDGRLGPGTRRAIERLQADRKLPVTGEIGPRTAREMGLAGG